MIFGYGFVDHGDAPLTEDAPFGRPRGTRSDEATAARLIRLAAPFSADQVINTSTRVSNAKAKAELCWQPSMRTYRHGAAALAATLTGAPDRAPRPSEA